MNFYDTIILGSSYFGIGFAVSSGTCLIAERSQLADPNFFGTLNGFSVEYSDNWENETKELFDFYKVHGCISENKFDPLLSEVLLCSFMRQKSIDPLFGTDAFDICKENDHYNLTLINNGGHEHISAKRIIDTRPMDEKRNLNILCKGSFEKKDLHESSEFDIEISEAFEKDEKILTFAFKKTENTNTAKAKAIEFLYENFKGKDAKIIEEAYLMYGDTALPVWAENEIIGVRVLSFKSAFDAFDAGVKFAKEVKKQ